MTIGGDDSERGPRTVGQVIVLATAGLLVLALAYFVPGPVALAQHKRDAAELIDQVEQRRDEISARITKEHIKVAPLGAPVRAWTSVRCWLQERLSDGDGEHSVMFYHQICAPAAYEVYAVPAAYRTAEQTAALLRGRAGEVGPECRRSLTTSWDRGQIDYSIHSSMITWYRPSQGDEECSLPEPGTRNETRVQLTTDKPLTASSYVVVTVYGKTDRSRAGCERNLGWFGSCKAEPKGAPYL